MDKQFSKEIKIGQRLIGEKHPAYIIAEIGANFDGDIEKAKKLVLAAKESGADCAKFQSFLAEKIVSDKGFQILGQKAHTQKWKKSVTEVFKAAEFPREWHKEIAQYCKEIGIDFSSAPYDFEGVDLLDELDVPFIKIGSGEVNCPEMLAYIAKKGRPVFLATGDATLAEVDEAVAIIKASGNKDLVLMQCITNYPSKVESANIRVVQTYKTAFDVIPGYSDHSPGDLVILGSIALGAKVIEKHFTLNTKDAGPDHPHSMDVSNFKVMIDKIRELEVALGDGVKEVAQEEKESDTIRVQRRALYANKDITKGEKLTKEDIIELRPALGILPKFKQKIIGRTLNKDLEKGMPIYWEDIA